MGLRPGYQNKTAQRFRRWAVHLKQMLVRLAGIEPTTPWFVAKYSIQLSYSREGAKYTTRTDLWVKLRAALSGTSGLIQILTGFIDLLPQGFPFLGRQTR